MKKIASFLFLFFIGFTQAQQLNCTVQVISDKVTTANSQIFKNLEKSISEFVNKTDWTGEEYKQHEKINCSMVITVNTYDSNQFTATLQIESSRPIFNSSYSSPVFNYNDKDFSFRYIEFENLTFNPSTFDSNLISVLAFYSYMILGFDADTYALYGGRPWFDIAQQVLSVAQQSGYKGWTQADGNQNRYFLISDLLSGTFDAFRESMYEYHRNGLDTMTKDTKASKEKIMQSVTILSSIYNVRPNAFLTRVFFDAKVDEIVSILSGGPKVQISDTIDTLNRISPLNSAKWSTIKL
ncbi:DUF4835 family protein [Flavobacterium sp.]|uniref:type IX secretion system protein PorD n=1 Tax=Flavobacterium sp. TaxID=239 RepID=UPI0025D93C6F|nr:DUF4835 family protein [Flavobacterium sp.]